MIQAGRGFGFSTKALQMHFGSPMTQTNHFKSDRAVETFLPRAKHYALAATTDFLKQLIVAKIGEPLCLIRFLLTMESGIRITRVESFRAAAVIASGYRRIREQIKPRLKQAGSTKAFGCVGKNFRAALSTNSRCATHDGRAGCALPIMYCAEFCHTLRSQHTDQVAQLIFDIAGNGNSVADFVAQQQLITLAKPMEGLPKRIICHAQLHCDIRS